MCLDADVTKFESLYPVIAADYSFMVMSFIYQHLQFNCASRFGNAILAGIKSPIDEKGD